MASRPLHFFWILDCSGSMAIDGKMEALNLALREAVPHLQEVAAQEPHAEVLVRALAFSDGACRIVPDPNPVESFAWSDLTADERARIECQGRRAEDRPWGLYSVAAQVKFKTPSRSKDG